MVEQSEPFSISEDQQAQVMVEVEEMIVEYVLKTPSDFLTAAHDTDRGVDEGTIEPDDPPFWRAVAAELRARAASMSPAPRDPERQMPI